MKGWIEIAKLAHRAVCPMTDCVDCLFGKCDDNCDYQIRFVKELNAIIEEMSKEMIINTPCNDCGSSQCEVIVDKNGYMSIVCVMCGKIIVEGYSLSPWELLKTIQ